MANFSTSKWLLACLHYNEPWETFLVKAVKPYLDVAAKTGAAECFFFERSWEQGPHIRIWFRGKADILDTILKPNIREHFQQYFEARPSLLVEPRYPLDYPEQLHWHPNNSLHFVEKRPEKQRREGRLELALFQKQFQASSEIVLDFLEKKSNRWTYNEMISSAIRLHLGLAYSVGMGIAEAADFFRLLSKKWRTAQVQKMKKNDELPSPTMFRSFQKIFDFQKKDLVPFHAALWEVFKNYRQLGDEKMVNWFHLHADLSVELDIALENGRLGGLSFLLPPQNFKSQVQQRRWSYCAHFVRLTNNRLGIHHKDEGYLFHLMARSLAAVSAAPVKNVGAMRG